jgi:ABC-2 type transport system ATP-binding protein
MLSAIEVFNLTKYFSIRKSLKEIIFSPFKKKNKKLVLDNVGFEVKPATIFCLIGPNGAGKTTLIKILAGLILPDLGKVKVLGYDIIKEELKVKNSIGLFTGEERSFYWRLTARENLEFFASLYNLSKKEREKRINDLSRLLKVDNLNIRFQEYSTGMKQRIALIRCLLNDPKLILMDEPTKNLDPLIANELRNFIKDELVERQGKTVFFCTHNLKEAVFLGKYLAIMDKGKIKVLGTIEEIRKQAGFSQDIDIEEIFRFYVHQ